jgi:predicted acylesterase/phospholipase RssA
MKTLQITLITLTLAFSGCATVAPHQPVPAKFVNSAVIPEVGNGRFWGDKFPDHFQKSLLTLNDADVRRTFPGIYAKQHNYLAISGGGANGAFGAGLLGGWTAAGTRPEFTMVTGVSTGALSAPFAFLGPAYDAQLKEVYTTIKTSDIARKRNVITAPFSDSVATTEPLQGLLKKYITPSLLEAIAREHQQGRRLFIGTVNIEAGRPVIWNIGAIAASNKADKVQLIHKILLASAAIPVAFPPVSIPVEAGGATYDELHVDGGTGSQVFVYPAEVDWRIVTRKLKVKGDPRVWVIRNSFLEPDYQGIKRNIVPIGKRTIASLIRTQGIGDLYQIYALARRDGSDFNLAYIPSSFTVESLEEFDPEYMKQLYDLGYSMAAKGYPWKKGPPGFVLE